MQGLVESMTVHYLSPNTAPWKASRHITAVVVKIRDTSTGKCNLMLLPDGTNDADNWKDIMWVQDVPFDATGKTPGTWHHLEYKW